MEIASLIEPLESAIANPDLHSYLGKLADCMANNCPTPEIPEEICQKSLCRGLKVSSGNEFYQPAG